MQQSTHTTLSLINENRLQLIVFVRFQPDAASKYGQHISDKLNDKVGTAVNAVDKIASMVPGMIKEETLATESIDSSFNYPEAYSHSWDPFMEQIKNDIAVLDPENKIIDFSFSNEEIEAASTKLKSEIMSATKSWTNKAHHIHFIGLAKGGNIIHHCCKQLIRERHLQPKGTINSVLSIGSSLHTKDILEQQDAANCGNIINYKSILDLNSKCIQYHKEPEQLIKFIREQNQTPIKFFTQHIQLKIAKIIALLFNGLHIGLDNKFQSLVTMVDGLKNELSGLADDTKGIVEHILTSIENFIQIPSLKQYIHSHWSTFGNLPDKMMIRLKNFVDELTQLPIDETKPGIHTKPINIGPVLNFLVPVIDVIEGLLSHLMNDLQSEESRYSKNNIINKDSFHIPATTYDKTLLIQDPYLSSHPEEFDRTDEAAILVHNTQALVEKIALQQHAIIHARTLANALALPMLHSKIELLSNLLEKIGLQNSSNLLDKMKANTLFAPILRKINSIPYFQFELDNTASNDSSTMGFQHALSKLDTTIDSIKQSLSPSYYKSKKEFNTLHFVFNSHNNALKQVPIDVKIELYYATGIHTYKLSKGFILDPLSANYRAPTQGITTQEALPFYISEETT